MHLFSTGGEQVYTWQPRYAGFGPIWPRLHFCHCCEYIFVNNTTHRWQICHRGKFATGVNNTIRTRGKICPWCRWYRRQICRRWRWYRWKIATGAVDTGGKFATGANLPRVSTTQAELVAKFAPLTPDANLPLVSLSPVTNLPPGKICHRCQQHNPNLWQNLPLVSLTPVANLPLVSLTQVMHFDLRISPQIFQKIWNDPNVIIRGLGEGDLWRKPEAKNLVTLSL